MTPIPQRTPSMKRHSSPRCSTPCDRLWRPCPALRTQGRHPAMAQRGAWKARRLRWWMTPPARPRAARRGALRVGRAGDVPRIVKIFELAFLLEVTPPTIAALHLVFRPPITDTHRQEGRRRLQGRGDGLETPDRVYHGNGRAGTAAPQ